MERPEFTNEQIEWINYIFNKWYSYHDRVLNQNIKSMKNSFSGMILPKKCECCKKNDAAMGANICLICSTIDDHEGPIFK